MGNSSINSCSSCHCTNRSCWEVEVCCSDGLSQEFGLNLAVCLVNRCRCLFIRPSAAINSLMCFLPLGSLGTSSQPLDTFDDTWHNPLSHHVAAAALSSMEVHRQRQIDYCQDSNAQTYDDITSHLTNMTTTS